MLCPITSEVLKEVKNVSFEDVLLILKLQKEEEYHILILEAYINLPMNFVGLLVLLSSLFSESR